MRCPRVQPTAGPLRLPTGSSSFFLDGLTVSLQAFCVETKPALENRHRKAKGRRCSEVSRVESIRGVELNNRVVPCVTVTRCLLFWVDTEQGLSMEF